MGFKYLLPLLAVLVFPLSAIAQIPPGNVYDTAPFSSNPKYFTSMNCGAPFSCSSQSDSTAMVSLADQCAVRNFGFPAGIMKSLTSRGTYKNCVIPGSYAPAGTGLGAKAQWPVCCIKEGSNNTCQMVCHFYITNDVP